MTRPPRSALVLLAALAAGLVLTGAAGAKSYELDDATVTVNVQSNGALAIDEKIEYSFDGSFSGGYRDIPVTKGESVTGVSVLENGRRYQPGGCTQIGCTDSPGTYGVTKAGNDVRIVWHYSAEDETRTFELRYTLNGLAVAYDDVVDVNLNVWGDQWPVGLWHLEATMHAPGKIVRAWGNPVYIRGDVRLAGDTVYLRAINIPSKQFVELRALIPRSAFSSTSAMQVEHGKGLAKIVAEETADAAALERDHAKVVSAEHHPAKWILVVLALGILPALAVLLAVYWFFGREPRTGYDREYEQEPPTDTAPALVPTLLRQGGTAGSYEFTATLFDLIRRGVFTSKPVTTEVSTFAGLRKEEVSDLVLSKGAPNPNLHPWEMEVANVATAVLSGGPVKLTDFRMQIELSRTAMSKRFAQFKADVSFEVDRRRWFVRSGIAPSSSPVSSFSSPPFFASRGPRSAGGRPTSAGPTSSWLGSGSRPRSTWSSSSSRSTTAGSGAGARPQRPPRPRAGRRSAATSPTSRGCRTPRPRSSSSGSPTSSTGSPSGSRSACCTRHTSRCPRRSSNSPRSTGSTRAATSAAVQARSGSATSPPGSGRRSRPRIQARAASAAASRAAVAAAEAVAAAAPGSDYDPADSMKGALLSSAVAVCALAASAALAGAAHAGTGWVSCGSISARITFNIETRGLGCTAVKALLPKLQRFSKVKTIIPRKEFSYVIANGWLCYYEASHSAKAQDGELSSFDCRTTEGVSNGGLTTEIRWTDAAGVKPVELLPAK